MKLPDRLAACAIASLALATSKIVYLGATRGWWSAYALLHQVDPELAAVIVFLGALAVVIMIKRGAVKGALLLFAVTLVSVVAYSAPLYFIPDEERWYWLPRILGLVTLIGGLVLALRSARWRWYWSTLGAAIVVALVVVADLTASVLYSCVHGVCI